MLQGKERRSGISGSFWIEAECKEAKPLQGKVKHRNMRNDSAQAGNRLWGSSVKAGDMAAEQQQADYSRPVLEPR